MLKSDKTRFASAAAAAIPAFAGALRIIGYTATGLNGGRARSTGNQGELDA